MTTGNTRIIENTLLVESYELESKTCGVEITVDNCLIYFSGTKIPFFLNDIWVDY